MKSKVAIVRCPDYDAELVYGKLCQAIELIGGIRSYIRPASRVLVKPNLLMAKQPNCGITTHPEIVRAMIRILHSIDCQVFVGDGPSVFGRHLENVDEVYEVTGIKKVVREEKAELVYFDKRRWREKFPLTTWLDECDYCVNLPKFKTHSLTVLTGAVKNLFGLIPGTYKAELHKNFYDPESFSRILVDLYEIVRPALTVVDGVISMEADGPATSGKLKKTQLILAGKDAVALDSVMARIMGIEPEIVLTNKEASRRNLGQLHIQNIDILGERLEDVVTDFILPTTSFKTKLPRPIVDLAKKLIRYYPCVIDKHCRRCLICVSVCPVKVISLKKGRIVFDYSRCIGCFCCLESCPYAAIKVRKSLAALLMGL